MYDHVQGKNDETIVTVGNKREGTAELGYDLEYFEDLYHNDPDGLNEN